MSKTDDIIFLSYTPNGDCLSLNGMIRFLLKFYKKIFYRVPNPTQQQYLRVLYNDISDNRIILYNDDEIQQIINSDINILNQMYPECELYKTEQNKSNYFNRHNPISKILGLPDLTKQEPPYLLSNSTTFYFTNCGIDPDYCITNFYYRRNKEIENQVYEQVLKLHGLTNNDKYIIVSLMPNIKLNTNYIENKNLKFINICFLVDMPLYLIKLLENAEEIHVVEHSNALMMYHLHASKNFFYKKKIFMHYYARNRTKFLIDMYKYPILPNWIFLD